MVFIAELIVRSTCFGRHYAHHQELKSYADGFCLWYMALWFTGRWSGVECSPLSTGILYGPLQTVTIPDAVIIQSVLLKIRIVLLETC